MRRTLPAIDRALGFTREERTVAEDLDRLDCRDGEESVLDGLLRRWRQTGADGRGLCAAQATSAATSKATWGVPVPGCAWTP